MCVCVCLCAEVITINTFTNIYFVALVVRRLNAVDVIVAAAAVAVYYFRLSQSPSSTRMDMNVEQHTDLLFVFDD